MTNWDILKSAIAETIKTNGNQEITGQLLQNALNSIVTSVGKNATFAGIATPATNPGAPDGPVFYLASTAGTYNNFAGTVIASGISVLEWKNSSWVKHVFFNVDDEPIDGSENLVKSGGVKNDFFYINDYRSKDEMILGIGHPQRSGKWAYVDKSSAIVLIIKQGDTIKIKANSSQPTVLSVLKSYKPKNDTAVDYATGETRRVILANTDETINITSSDAKFLHIVYTNTSEGLINYAPEKLIVNDYDYGKSVQEYINSIIASKFVTGISEKLIKDIPSTDFSRAGFYYTDNFTVFQSNTRYATTELIEVEGQNLHVRLHTVCPTTVAAIILYDKYQSPIAAIPGLTDALVYSDIEFDIDDDYPSAHYVTFTSRSGYSNKATITENAKTTNELLSILLENNSNTHYIFDVLDNILDVKQDKYSVLAVYNYYKGLYKGKYGNGLVKNNGFSGYVNVPEAKHIVLPIKSGDVINVKAAKQQPCLISILSDYKEPTIDNQPFSFAIGESRRVISVGSQVTINVTASDAKYMVVNISYIDISYIPLELKINGYDLTSSIEEKINSVKPSTSAKNFMGHVDAKVNSKKYIFVPCYGQSLSNGSDSIYVTDPVVDGCYMLGNIVATQASLVPLQLTSGQQHPIVSCVNSLATLMHKYYDDKCKYIAASLGIGGRSIAQLSKASRITQYAHDYDYPIKDAGNYESGFLASLDNAITAVGGGNLECPAIIYLQGERDYVTDSQAPDAQPGSVDAAYACEGNKDLYKSRMMDLKNDMQADIMAKFGQSYKPIFCIYEVSGAFIKNDKMTINMAQIEFAQENDDVYLMPSPYFVPDYGAHLSTNGYRWYGEFLAKALFGILCQDSYWKPILPYQFKIDEDKIIISLENYTGKLQFDATLVEQSINEGFAVFINDSYAAGNILGLEIDDNHIIITCNQLLVGKKVELVYGGNKTSGSGNVRDNDVYRALYTYWNDTNDHGASGDKTIGYRPNIIGQKYPMYNWLASFYKLIQE